MASSPKRGNMIPTQLGPTMRSRLGFAASSIACGSARPNSPLPPKPVVMTRDARVPRWLSSLIRGATISGGGDDGQIQGSRQACDVCIDAHAIDSAGMRVASGKFAGNAGAAEVARDHHADRARPRSCPD